MVALIEGDPTNGTDCNSARMAAEIGLISPKSLLSAKALQKAKEVGIVGPDHPGIPDIPLTAWGWRISPNKLTRDGIELAKAILRRTELDEEARLQGIALVKQLASLDPAVIEHMQRVPELEFSASGEFGIAVFTLEYLQRYGDGHCVIAPLIRAWLERPNGLNSARLTATKGYGNAGGMVRRPELLSTLTRIAWEDAGPVDGVIVDGEPLSARMTDLSEAFRKPRSRPRRKAMCKPGDQGELIPSPPQGIRRVMPELRMTALEGLPPILAGDAHILMTWGHALDTPLRLTETEGAALLSRKRDGEFRRPLDSDCERFRDAMAALRGTLIYDPYRPDSRSPDWREITDVQRTAAGRYVIGPPNWARQLSAQGQRWTLTAQGSRATARYKLAGEQSMAGRIVTGLEYRLYAHFDGKSGPGPDVRPASGKSGPGRPVSVDWRECLALAGDWHDPTDNAAINAARMRFHRAVATLKRHGYFLPERKGPDGRMHPNLRGEARAGDTVEIISRERGGRGTTGGAGGLLIRASARYIEATDKANRKDGKGFESVPLVDYAGQPLLPPPDGENDSGGT